MSAYFRVPFPPSIWQAYYRRGTANIKSQAYKAFREACLYDLRKAKMKISNATELEMSIMLFSNSWYTKKKSVRIRDVDNYLKCIIDVVTEYARTKDKLFDDSRIFELYASKEIPREGEEDHALISISARKPRHNNS